MILVPMQDARQRHIFLQLPERNPHPRCPKPYRLCRLAYPQHRHAFPRDKGFIPQGLQAVRAAVVLGYHAEAGGAAVHRVELVIVGKILHTYYQQIFRNSDIPYST